MMKTAKPILILQLRPEDVTSDSEYKCFLNVAQLKPEDTHRMRIEKSGIVDPLRLQDYSAIIVGGSPFDISTDDNKKSSIQKKIETDFNRLLDIVVSSDFPFLGACSGNGLLGNYLGTRISTLYSEPVGCETVTITQDGKQDPLLKNFPDTIDVLLGHKEACDNIPSGSTLLITGKNCPVQMFRVGKNVYATQFHPESDPEEFKLRIDTYRDYGYFKPHEAEELKQQVCDRDTPYSKEILRRFVQKYHHEQI